MTEPINQNLNWLQKFLNNEDFGHMRFKRLNIDYLKFDMDEEFIDIVELEEFVKIEENRLPFFIGSQFGVHPSIAKIPGIASQDRLIAILGKSVLSGHVAGLSIYKVIKGEAAVPRDSNKKIITFENWD